jgi:hypothetical protein
MLLRIPSNEIAKLLERNNDARDTRTRRREGI